MEPVCVKCSLKSSILCACNDVWLCQGRELGRVGWVWGWGGVARETKCMGVCESVCVREGGGVNVIQDTSVPQMLS